jgi:hypothetical protein
MVLDQHREAGPAPAATIMVATRGLTEAVVTDHLLFAKADAGWTSGLSGCLYRSINDIRLVGRLNGNLQLLGCAAVCQKLSGGSSASHLFSLLWLNTYRCLAAVL